MLIWVFTAAAVLCLVYYGVIVLYAGFGTSFAVLWLLIGGFFGATAAGIHFYQKYPERVPLWLPVSFVTLCASGLMIVLVTQILIFGRIPAAAEPSLDYVIVLGAKVKPDGSLSKTLKLRLDKALEYMKENPETMLVLSGAKGDAEPCSEADAMETYLLGQGADPDHLLKEEQSFSTVENLAYSRVMIEKRENLLEQERKAEADRLLRAPGEIEGVPETGAPTNNTPVLARQPRVGIITSNFHLCRAAMIAKKQDYGTVYGIASEADKVLLVHFSLRDGIALLKDRLMGNL
ncbi:YdcF family protein [Clostridium sp. AF27-2AA]|jgi:uncharacterized SAM-binding protein YcdF (DUF218 family)|uniref:YdcF family protein n=1 Tax=Clostridium sp. AF27-2AA TaxID=2292206 RepID=UPI000E50AA3C|nr:YdcF family protein [Clostridium sp. AF27-2AA]RHQ29646.1 YdcF family protein [Clostridium sp. AF27-2AA]